MKRTRERLERAWAMVRAGIVRKERACDGKAAYPNKNDVRHDAKLVFKRTGRVAVTYKCEWCAHFHLSKLKHGEEVAA